MSQTLIDVLEAALEGNPGCECGLLAARRAFIVANGPSGGPEALVLMMADEAYGTRFWYGHVMRSASHPRRFLSILCWSDKFINAPNVPLLFRRYHHWTQVVGHWNPCAIQHPDDAFAECWSFAEAVHALAKIIGSFDLRKRTAQEGSEYSRSPAEMRILTAYGSGLDTRVQPPPVPTAAALRLVKVLG